MAAALNSDIQRIVDRAMATAAAAVKALPVTPTECECGTTNCWQVITVGYTQLCDAEFDEEGALVIQQNGWDDMTEDGEFTYVHCGACGAAYSLPDHVWWG